MKTPILGTMLRQLRSPYSLNLVKNSGLDFAMLDAEHGFYDMQEMASMFSMARALGIRLMVRVPELSRAWVSRVLDAGAAGVMVPMVETAAMAREMASYGKYPPVGNRGLTTSAGHTDYLSLGAEETMSCANAATLLIAQIETAAALENCDDIAAADGVDALLIGPNDLSVSLGHPGRVMEPDELSGIARVQQACRKHGKLFGMHASLDMMGLFMEGGIDIIMHSTDTDLLAGAMAGLKQKLDALAGGK